ncbi:MAG: M1 family metallopeptidase, partial [Bacteroidota bacterium]|nr:M1 family metallopeptidase [Bacteroidota bacterium]
MKFPGLILFFIFFLSGNGFSQFLEFEKNIMEPGNYLEVISQKSLKSAQLQDYDVKWYFLDLEADNLSVNIKGNVTILVEIILEGMDELVVELASDMFVDSIVINSQSRSFTHSGDLLSISLANPLARGDLLEFRIYYHGQPSQGVFHAIDPRWGVHVSWTLSEPFSAKNWFPCKQDLKDKADSSRVFITTVDGLMAGSNGLLKNIVPLVDSKVRYEWFSNYPIVYYLISFAISDYQDYSFYAHPQETDSILVQNYIYDDPSCLNAFENDLKETSELIELYSDLYSQYPFYDEKYGHCLVPSGSYMEHQTMSTMKDFVYRIVAHELAHQWFGDQVTCASWQDIWINEGFASYSEYIALENLRSHEDAHAWMKNAHAYALERPQGSVYIPFEESGNVGRIFDYRLSYKKGAAIIHMLRFELDDDLAFFETLKEFQSDFRDSVAIGLDFKEVAESVSGMDLTTFFDQWYFGKGYPLYEIKWGQVDDTLWINTTQLTSTTETPLFKMPLEFRFDFTSGDSIVRVFQDEVVESFKFKVSDYV